MVGAIRLLARLLLWPVAGPRRAVIALAVCLGGLGWWRFEDEILRLLGLGRPPERTVELRLSLPETSDPERERTFAERYEPLTPEARRAALAELRTRFASARDAAFEALRARGAGRRTAFARTGEVPLADAGDPQLLTRVVLDPAEAPGSEPVALTLTLEREAWPAVYSLLEELDWLDARVARDPPPPPELIEAGGH